MIARLNTEVARIIHLPEAKAVLVHEGAEPVGNTPEQFGTFVADQRARTARLIREANITLG